MSPKQRFMIMVVIDAICVALAVVAMVAYAGHRQPFGLPLFAAAMLVGFAAQIWFIVGLVKSTRLAKRL